MWIPQPKQLWIPGQPKPPCGTQIDWADPLSQGLVGCWLFNEGAGNIVNLATGKKYTRCGGGGTWGTDGYDSRNSGAGFYASEPAVALACSGKGYTVITTQKSFDIAGYSPMLGFCDGYSTNITSYGLGVQNVTYISSNRYFDIWGHTSSSVSSFAYGLVDIQYGVSENYCLSVHNTGTAYGYFNGKLFYTQPGITFNPTLPSTIKLLDRNYGTSQTRQAVTKLMLLYSRALSAPEIQRLHELTKGW